MLSSEEVEKRRKEINETMDMEFDEFSKKTNKIYGEMEKQLFRVGFTMAMLAVQRGLKISAREGSKITSIEINQKQGIVKVDPAMKDFEIEMLKKENQELREALKRAYLKEGKENKNESLGGVFKL